ncbi:MAG: hypothetical protein RJA70_1096 [Pseudomonadota bacterium]|jgi:hypothetical protein
MSWLAGPMLGRPETQASVASQRDAGPTAPTGYTRRPVERSSVSLQVLDRDAIRREARG